LEINGNSLEPVFRDGDILIVAPQANIRRGDRVVLRTRAGGVMVTSLRRRSARKLELQSLVHAREEHAVSTDDVEWVARIVWASQ